jgi:hypothetical protein
MNDIQLEQQILDDEIKKMRLNNQIMAYQAQAYDKKRQLLELKKTEIGIKAQLDELELKISEVKAQM